MNSSKCISRNGASLLGSSGGNMSPKTKDFLQKICYKRAASVDMTQFGFIIDSKVNPVNILLKPLKEQLKIICEKNNNNTKKKTGKGLSGGNNKAKKSDGCPVSIPNNTKKQKTHRKTVIPQNVLKDLKHPM